jgi:hypothetical protein
LPEERVLPSPGDIKAGIFGHLGFLKERAEFHCGVLKPVTKISFGLLAFILLKFRFPLMV